MFNNLMHIMPPANKIRDAIPLIYTMGESRLNPEHVYAFLKHFDLSRDEVNTIMPYNKIQTIVKIVESKKKQIEKKIKINLDKNNVMNENFVFEIVEKSKKRNNDNNDSVIHQHHHHNQYTTNIHNTFTRKINQQQQQMPYNIGIRPGGSKERLIIFLSGLLVISLVMIIIYYVNKKSKYKELYTFKDFLKELYIIIKNLSINIANATIKAFVSALTSIIVILTIVLTIVYILPPLPENSHPIFKIIYNAVVNIVIKSKTAIHQNMDTSEPTSV